MIHRPAGASDASHRHCAVWALPPDTSCAAVARHELRRALRAMNLADEAVADATLAVSELVSNAYLHVVARHGAYWRSDLELWLYRRGRAESSQVVCKVFDARRDRTRLRPAVPLALNSTEHGRGLGIVEAMVAEWGVHLTRSRLGDGWGVPGKVVWFAMPAPPSPDDLLDGPVTAAQAAYAIQDQLAARGIMRAIRRHDHDLTTVPVHPRVTVHCGGGAFTWTHDGVRTRVPYTDLVDAGERLVRLHEELSSAEDGEAAVAARPGGYEEAELPGRARRTAERTGDAGR
jgi:hypothetical protein